MKEVQPALLTRTEIAYLSGKLPHLTNTQKSKLNYKIRRKLEIFEKVEWPLVAESGVFGTAGQGIEALRARLISVRQRIRRLKTAGKRCLYQWAGCLSFQSSSAYWTCSFFRAQKTLIAVILALLAGEIFYMLFYDMIPEVHKERKRSPTFGAVLGFIVGFAIVRIIGSG